MTSDLTFWTEGGTFDDELEAGLEAYHALRGAGASCSLTVQGYSMAVECQPDGTYKATNYNPDHARPRPDSEPLDDSEE